MNLLLNHQQIHERFVDHRVGPVPLFVEQPAKCVFHGARGRGEHVRLDRGQVNDVLADESPGYHEPVRIDPVQAQKIVRKAANRIADVDPLHARLVQVDVAQAVRLDDVHLLVLALAHPGIDHDRAVVAAVNAFGRIPVALHGPDHAVKLPGRGGTAREKEMPAYVDLEGGIFVLGQDVLVTGKVHEAVRVAQNGGRRGFQNGDGAGIHCSTPRQISRKRGVFIAKRRPYPKTCLVK